MTDYLTPGQNLMEARRLLLVADEVLQDPDEPRSLGDLAILALAHAVTAAVAAGACSATVSAMEPLPLPRRPAPRPGSGGSG